MPTDTFHILDIPFSCCSFADILLEMKTSIDRRSTRNYISITNTESAYHATNNSPHLRYIRSANFSCCDGIGITLVGKLYGYNIPRLHGPDLMLKCCRFGLENQWRHYFYGGTAETLNLLRNRLPSHSKGMIICGTHSPPFRSKVPYEEDEIIDLINASKPDILWVGLGLLKQEKWIEKHLDRIDVPWMVGVGAAFDFHAGTVKRAPSFYQKAGLEWLYRVTFEPRMLIRNYYSLLLVLKALKDIHNK